MVGEDFGRFWLADKSIAEHDLLGRRRAARRNGTRPTATRTKLPSLHSPFWAPDAETVISTATEAMTIAALGRAEEEARPAPLRRSPRRGGRSVAASAQVHRRGQLASAARRWSRWRSAAVIAGCAISQASAIVASAAPVSAATSSSARARACPCLRDIRRCAAPAALLSRSAFDRYLPVRKPLARL